MGSVPLPDLARLLCVALVPQNILRSISIGCWCVFGPLRCSMHLRLQYSRIRDQLYYVF